MKCGDCDVEIEIEHDFEFEIIGIQDTIDDGPIAAKANVIERLIASCDCTKIEVDKKGHRVSAIPPNWIPEELKL